MTIPNCFVELKQAPPAENNTAPSNRHPRPPPIDTVSSPPPPSSFDQQPQSPRGNDSKGFSRPPLVHQRSSGSGNAIEALQRQMSLSSMGGNDATTANGQPSVHVKDAKVTPSTEFHGAVTRAKEGESKWLD